MQQTTNYQFKKWEKSDRILMDDFNWNINKIDEALKSCGNCKIVMGNYTGTGTYGYGAQNTLFFDSKPLTIFIASDYQFFAINGTTIAMAYVDSQQNALERLTWGETTFTWCNTESAFKQLNTSGQTYF